MSCSAIFILSSVYIVTTSVWLGRFLSPKCLHYGENISVSFNLDLVLRYPQIRLIFQSLPIMADVLFSQPRGSNIIVVISPLKALMEDQVSIVFE